MNKQTCASQHFGLWAVNSRWMDSMVQAYNAGSLPKREAVRDPHPQSSAGKLPKSVYAAGDIPGEDPPLYTVDQTGVGYLSINGAITKGRSSYGGTSSVMTKRAVRTMEADTDVKGIMVMVDSPGGTVDGNKAMADEIAAVARRGVKPIVTHAEGSMHSAALWAGVQTQRVTASDMTEIGSIGTVATVYDYSEAAKADGVRVHVVSTGWMKGAFTPGAEVTTDQLEWLQSRVDQMNEFFIDAVKKGRKMSVAKVKELGTGEDWLAADAKANGLIDEVMSEDDAIQSFRRMIRDGERIRDAARRSRARAAQILEMGG